MTFFLTTLYLLMAFGGVMAIVLPLYGRRFRQYLRIEGVEQDARVFKKETNTKGPKPRYELHFQYEGPSAEPIQSWGNVTQAMFDEIRQGGQVRVLVHPRNPKAALLVDGLELRPNTIAIRWGLVVGFILITASVLFATLTFGS